MRKIKYNEFIVMPVYVVRQYLSKGEALVELIGYSKLGKFRVSQDSLWIHRVPIETAKSLIKKKKKGR